MADDSTAGAFGRERFSGSAPVGLAAGGITTGARFSGAAAMGVAGSAAGMDGCETDAAGAWFPTPSEAGAPSSERTASADAFSGARSDVYFDKFRFLADPQLLRDLAAHVRSLLPPDVTHLASPEGAATLLLAAVALETDRPMAVVRKEPKGYGTRSRIEGYAPHGASIALIEDVSTTGHQVAAAARGR